jgi:kynurenine formamidase
MNISVHLSGHSYSIHIKEPIDISIPLRFNGPQPNTYGVMTAQSSAYMGKNFIGDTRRGGSCNFETHTLTPHCNGTHTECVGHISLERISLHRIFGELLIPSTLVSIEPENAEETAETYLPEKTNGDRIITAKKLYYELNAAPKDFLKALLIRTHPNDDSKKERNYETYPPPFFSLEAMDYITELGVEHLLVDIPSLDRDYDEGRLSAHHLFWAVPQGSHDVDPEACSVKTITEMIFVPNEIIDGKYFLNLQIPAFVADAAPSRPILFKPH